jgi:predicted ATP-grasp superfamily ATP-dependent carboligase
VIKPRDGAGSLQTWFEAGGAQSEARAKHFRPRFASGSAYLIAQEYVKGFAVSVSFLIGPNSTAPLIPCAQRLSRDGRFQYEGGYLPIAPELADRATRIATSAIECVPGLLGYIGVDIVLGEDGRDWAIEINPRLTTSYVGLRALAKFNTAEAMLAIVRGDSPPEMTWGSDSIQFTPDGQISPLAA